MKVRILITISLAIFLAPNLWGQSALTENEESAISMVKKIYTVVSRDAGGEVDWEEVRSFFVPEASILLQTTLTESSLLTVDGFITDFQNFYASPGMEGKAFNETVLGFDSRIFRGIAYVGVMYEAKIPDLDRPPNKGIDLWLLTKKEDGWKVLSVVNEVILPGEDIPKIFAAE